jgi:hypothetical protein
MIWIGVISMKTRISILVLLFAASVASVAAAQSLGDMAQKEKERRAQVKVTVKTITNDDTSKYRAGSVTTGSVSKPAAENPKAEGQQAASKAEKSDEPVDLQGRPESYWRQTLYDANKRVTDLENGANVITLKIADLQNQFYRESDGFKQQAIQRDLQKTFFEQDLNKENLAKAKQSLQELEIEARKSGALPGWLDGKPPVKNPPD